MQIHFKIFLLIASSLLLFNVSCGKKGPPLPPIMKIPKSAVDFTATQAGDKVQLMFTMPVQNTDNTQPAEINTISVYRKIEIVKAKEEMILEVTPDKIKDYLSQGKFIAFDSALPANAIKDNQKILYNVKIFSKKNKNAGSSNSAIIALQPVLESPTNAKAELKENVLKLSWDYTTKEPGAFNFDVYRGWDYYTKKEPIPINFNVYRGMSADFKPIKPINDKLIETTSYEDHAIKAGETYYYKIRAINVKNKTESMDSPIVRIGYKDVFAPETPSDLVGVVLENHVALHWKSVETVDLSGYKVYRKGPNESEFRLITPAVITESAFDDTEIKEGNEYSYYVTAMDNAVPANESKPSKIVIVTFSKK